MKRRIYHQKLPRAGPDREALREKGQFWTPAWVAEAMVGYAIGGGSKSIFDPAVGAGAFFAAGKAISKQTGRKLRLLGTELVPDVLREATKHGLKAGDLTHVKITDFVLSPPHGLIPAIVANPPYIRHHRLTLQTKLGLKELGTKLIGSPLDGRAGYHVYFLLRALQLLATDGRLAFIMPADTCEGVFSQKLWKWITTNYRLDAVITFAPDASPFPGVDTNPIIFLIRKSKPAANLFWARCLKPDTNDLKRWTLSGFRKTNAKSVSVHYRNIDEGVITGLSRPPFRKHRNGPFLKDYARTLRGIATGANDFFFLTTQQASDLHIPSTFLRPAIGRTRDVSGDEITDKTLKELELKQIPTLLFSPDGRPLESFPEPVRDYIRQGESLELHKRALIASRRPWYKMEVRKIPPFLFAYLGRRNARFIKNTAGILPLTGFLCVYPLQENPDYLVKLWAVLNHPQTIKNLKLVGKTYGSGAIKVEPRALENLPIPLSVLDAVSLPRPNKPQQLQFKLLASL